MGLRSNGFYATVWDVRPGKGNYIDVNLSTSKKDPKDNTKYITDYNGFARFVGSGAKELAAGLKRLDRIHVTEFEVTNHFDQDKKVTFTNLTVFAAEMIGQNRSTPTADSSPKGFMNIPDDVDEQGLPFN